MVFSFRFPIRFVSGCCLFHPPLLAWIAFERMPFQRNGLAHDGAGPCPTGRDPSRPRSPRCDLKHSFPAPRPLRRVRVRHAHGGHSSPPSIWIAAAPARWAGGGAPLRFAAARMDLPRGRERARVRAGLLGRGRGRRRTARHVRGLRLPAPLTIPFFEVFPLEALRLAVDPGYGDRIRALSEHAETLSPFRIGTVSLRAAVDSSGLSLTLSAPARLRMAALDGVAASPGGQSWLVEPGGWETDVPAFRLLLRPFAALSATAESLLGDPARVSLDGEAALIPGFDAAGTSGTSPAGQGGNSGSRRRSAAPEPKASLARLPLRHKPLEEESGLPVLHILTGFLGSGKTTFLRQWLDFLHGRERYTGVIQNEFGEIGLDAALLRGETQVEALDEGCVCCSLADSLRPGLLRLIGDMPAEQFILETTGLANPANVMEALSELRDIVQPGLVITVADALDLCRSEGDIAGIRRAQAARADVIILNKADTVEPAALEALAERLRALNRQALILPARHGAVAFAELDAFYADWADRRARRCRRIGQPCRVSAKQ